MKPESVSILCEDYKLENTEYRLRISDSALVFNVVLWFLHIVHHVVDIE